jgi:hypothetical protein
MQRELLGQRITQFAIVIDDQNFARVRHSFEDPLRRPPPFMGLASVPGCNFLSSNFAALSGAK